VKGRKLTPGSGSALPQNEVFFRRQVRHGAFPARIQIGIIKDLLTGDQRIVQICTKGDDSLNLGCLVEFVARATDLLCDVPARTDIGKDAA
jgi:hypothetical protein